MSVEEEGGRELTNNDNRHFSKQLSPHLTGRVNRDVCVYR